MTQRRLSLRFGYPGRPFADTGDLASGIARGLRTLAPQWKSRLSAATIATVAGAALLLNAGLDDPPRFDGAGYAVLARSILAGSGYRAIDHPDAPRHAHFPPGYPLALAALWTITGPSNASAHAFSILCTIAATLLAHRLFRVVVRATKIGLILGLSPWRSTGDGPATDRPSSPSRCSSWSAYWRSSFRGETRARSERSSLGLILGFAVLVRHVGVCVAGRHPPGSDPEGEKAGGDRRGP